MNERPVNLLFLSNMMEEKGVWTLLSACSLLRDRGCSFQCHFVGRWSDISETMFNSRTTNLRLHDHVMAHGPVYGSKRTAYFSRADVFVLPTYYHNECFPLVLIEAMQHGLACVSTYEGAIPEMIDDGRTGFLVERRNPSMLADKLQVLIEKPELCRRMGLNGNLKYKENYTIEQFEHTFISILDSI